ncbi:MAG TPA: YlcI/YnfO family protein [Rubrivivax sp.]|nr:YlcI/YnfO family protein [Rubrivivax sp.]
MRTATFPPIRVEPELRAEVEAVLREGESLTQFIEAAVVAAAAWRRVQAGFVTRGEAAIERWKREGGGHTVDEVMDDLQTRLDDAKRRSAQRKDP